MKRVTEILEEQRRIALFADIQNIYYTVQERYHRNLDYAKIWKYLLGLGEIVQATAYAIDRDDENQKRFQHKLKEIGFTVKLKPYIQRADGSAKGDWDVGITIDVLEDSAHTDIVVLATGDGDFSPLIDRIKSKYGVEVWIISVASLTAKSLIDSADKHIPIDGEMLINRT